MSRSKKELLSIINHEDEEYFRWKKDMKCVAENPNILMQRVIEGDERKSLFKVRKVNRIVHSFLTKTLDKKIAKHIAKLTGPAWFQELSEIQIIAADSLFDAISCDSEDIQYFRARKALLAIGLNPTPSRKETLAAIEFSRGNDLAFLWQLSDEVYSKCDDITKKTSCTINQRLLLTCICHLDMMTTLRELDKILPKPDKKIKFNKIPSTQKLLKYSTPYDEPVPKPKLQRKRFFSKPQSLNPKFELYKKYEDPNHVIRNESNRWFAEDNSLSSEARNICKAIVCKQIKNVFDKNFDRSNIFEALCEKHRPESEKFNQLMKKILEGKLFENNDDDLLDYDEFERGIIYGVQLEFAKADKEMMELDERLEKEIIVKSQLREVIADAINLRYVHLCEKCEDCFNVPKSHNENRGVNSSEPQSDDGQVKFFHRSTTTSPFKFDHEKIFAMSFLNDCGVVKNSINSALKVDKHLTEDNAISLCLEDMWQQEMKKWNEKCQREMEEKSQKVIADWKKIKIDKRTIFFLLHQGIQLMKENPKFVLASLPDVERLPFLKEWILHRFGIRYSMKDNEVRLKMNKLCREYLDKAEVFPKVKVPTLKIFGVREPVMSYNEALIKSVKVSFLVLNFPDF